MKNDVMRLANQETSSSFLISLARQRTSETVPWYLSCCCSLFVCLFVCLVCTLKSPRAHHHVLGMLPFMSDINQPSLPTPFYSALVPISLLMALSTVFHSMILPATLRFLTLCFRSYPCLIGPFNYIYLFMKVSFSPDIIPSG